MQIGHAKTLEAHPDGSPEWHEQRSRGLGGSDAATIIGLKPYGQDRLKLWRRKQGLEPGFSGNSATDYGSKVERFVFSRAAVEYHCDIVEVEHGLQHPDHPWMLANVDGALVRDGNVVGIAEIKTSSSAPPSDGAHPYHYAQIQHYLAVTGLSTCAYIYLEVPFDRYYCLEIAERFISPGEQEEYWQWVIDQGALTIRTIDRDDAYIERLIEAEAAFWRSVSYGLEPTEYLPEGEVRIQSSELGDLMHELALVQAEKPQTPKSVTAREGELKEEIKHLAGLYSASNGDAKKIYIGDGDDYVLWNARGYWIAKPAPRAPKSDEVEVPF